MQQKRILFFTTLLLVIGGVVFFFTDEIISSLQGLQNAKQTAQHFVVQEIQDKVLTPPPLRASAESEKASALTRLGVVRETNTQRALNNLPLLTENAKLDAAAQAKAQDMFTKQYFEHVSPSGRGPAELAETAGYDYILIGENLALGNFEDDKALVEAWMNSPGHRENILHQRYQEIGVAVQKGIFEGKTTWIAVQEFGLPRSACPTVDDLLLSDITTNEDTIKTMETELADQKTDIDNTTPKRGPEYRAKVDAYNNLIAQYNALFEKTQTLINQYNGQVNTLDQCLGE